VFKIKGSYNMKNLLVLFILLNLFPAAYGAESSKAKNLFTISYNQAWPPYSMGEGDRVQGSVVDSVSDFIENNFELNVVSYGFPWKRAQSSVKKGDIDAFVTVPTKERLEYAYSSESVVYKIELVAITRDKNPNLEKISNIVDTTEFRKYDVCDNAGNGWGKRFHEKNKINYYSTVNLESCLGMIQAGRMDVTIQSKYAVAELLKKNPKLKNLKILPIVYGTMEFTLLISKKSKYGLDFIKEFDDKFKKSSEL
jgi:polar amino acid transport system substrate-binding protein